MTKKQKKIKYKSVIYFFNNNIMKLQNKKGFTLIELLVVITIIGILATWATATYTSQIQKARDTTRINDMKALQAAVEQVYQDSWEYPHPNQFDNGANITAATYLPKMPRDPKNWQTCNKWDKSGADWAAAACVYSYAVWTDDNSISYWTYILSTWFESKWKVDSDWKRDNWAHNWRWETWNWLMRTSKLKNDPSWAANDCINNALKTATWILNDVCAIGAAITDSTGDRIITIHWS